MDQYTLYGIVAALAGLVVGWLLTWLYAARKQAVLMTECRLHLAAQAHLEQQLAAQQQQLKQHEAAHCQLYATLSATEEKLQQLDYWRNECEKVNDLLRQQTDTVHARERELREVSVLLEQSRIVAEEKQQLLVASEQRLSLQFENLANRIFESSGRRVDEQNRQSLHGLLNPLREQLEGLRRQVNESFSQESRERHTLTHEIRQLQQLNVYMTEETANLTRALKGNNKIQGNWGEIVLSRVLEASGLREGHEYESQVNLTHAAGQMRPDVVVHLPQSKDVVIDAKMTLTAYERYHNAEEEEARQQALKEHLAAIRNHIKTLSGKAYQTLDGVNSLDYVLMFIPLEPAFILAIDRQPEIISEATRQNIILVSPTTLLVALRTIGNLWRYEHQSRNAQHIAERASRLYDKLRLFVDDMTSVGQYLDKTHHHYQQAMKKLASGRGNLIAQSEVFRQLGIEIKRPINPLLVKQAQAEDETRLE